MTVDRWLLLEVAGKKSVTEDSSSTSLRRESPVTQAYSFAGGVAASGASACLQIADARSDVQGALNISTHGASLMMLLAFMHSSH